MAQEKSTSMSSETQVRFGNSNNVVDGSERDNCFQISTVGGLNPWWQVDLQEIHRIFLIKVFWFQGGVSNVCDVILSIGRLTDSWNFERDKTDNPQIFRFPNGILGRVIRLTYNATLCTDNICSSLCEVKVFAEKATIDSDCTSDNECIETGGQCLSGKCSCSDFFRFNTSVNECIQVTIGSNCTSNSDCLETGGQCLYGQCSCNDSSRFNTTLNDCVNATIGSNCTSDTECTETGGQCLFGKCYCNKFSRFNTSVNDCVKVCANMTAEFEKYIHKKINEHNDLGRARVENPEECLQKCKANETCLSFETKYNQDTTYTCNMCSLSYEMVLDTEEYLITESNKNLSSRICN